MQFYCYLFQYIIDVLCKVSVWLVVFCLLVFVLVVSYEVVVCYIIGVFSSWIQEFLVYLMMVVGFLVVVYVF